MLFRSVETPVSLADVVPTVLEAAGVTDDGLSGESLVELASDPDEYDGRVVFSEVRGDSRYDEAHLRRFRADSAAESAWLEREIEAGETVDSEATDGSLLELLETHSERSLDGIGAVDAAEGGASKDVERRLEALGYKE